MPVALITIAYRMSHLRKTEKRGQKEQRKIERTLQISKMR
jgi:hypothetical protein